MSNAETPLQRAILQALTARGHWVWRSNSGEVLVKTPSKGRGVAKPRLFRGSPAGTPDITGMTADGTFIGIEVKTPHGRGPSPTQRRWIKRAAERGACVGVARSISEALAIAEGRT